MKSVSQDSPELNCMKPKSTWVISFLCQDEIDHYYPPLVESWFLFVCFQTP